MSEEHRQSFEQTHDLDFAYEVNALKSRFRANIFMGRLGISAVFRIIPAEILTVEQLGLPQTVLDLTEVKKDWSWSPGRQEAENQPPLLL